MNKFNIKPLLILIAILSSHTQAFMLSKQKSYAVIT